MYDQKKILTKVHISDNESITFEPGGQLEYSSNNYSTLSSLERQVFSLQNIIDEEFSQHGICFYQGGINPWEQIHTKKFPLRTKYQCGGYFPVVYA